MRYAALPDMRVLAPKLAREDKMELFAFDLNGPPFELDPLFIARFESRQPEWGPIGYVTYKRTYARKLCDCAVACAHPTEEFWQTCRRVVEGVYRIQQRHCQFYRLPWRADKAQRSAQTMYQLMWDFKFLPPGRGLWMMGVPVLERIGGAALNNPLHVDTPVLTKEHGWVPLGSLAGKRGVTLLSSIKLYGRDHTSTAASPTWVQADVSNIEIQSCKRLILRDNEGYVSQIVASENHRWFRRRTVKDQWERVASTGLREGDQLPLVLPAKNAPVSAFGAQHGLFFGDGTRSNGELHQFADSIDVLRELFGERAVKVDHRRDDEWVVRNCPRAWSVAPQQLDDASYVYGFLAGYFAADGCVSENGSCSLSAARRDELDEVRRLFLSIGVRAGEIRLSSDHSNFKDNRELWTMTVHNHDLWAEFFLRQKHRERWEQRGEEPKRKYARIVHIEDAGMQPVLCATVPDYEQFVIDGFVLTSNCAFVSTEHIAQDFSAPFLFLMDMSMLGVGVGGDCRGAGTMTVQRPVVDMGLRYVVEDSREGWLDIVRRVLDAYSGVGVIPGEIDDSLVRKAGAPIRGFGGVAAGPEPLQQLLHDIQTVLNPLVGLTITSEAIVDLFNYIGKCVVAGNVRRSAEIMFGHPSDEEFLNLKNPTDNAFALNDRRWASNNSIFAEVGMDYRRPAALTQVNGEPGYEWLENARAFGRMIDPADHRDRRAHGGNPCLEQTLESFELCCLVETFPSRHATYEEYQRTLKFAYLYAKTVTLVSTHDPRTNAVMSRNKRIGTSQSGITESFARHGRREHFRWCDRGYKYLRQLDEIYSEWLGVSKSIKITSVKPSGTVSLLPGVSPGIHYPIAEFYVRRMRVANNSPLLGALMRAGYPIQPANEDPIKTSVVSFPVHERYFTKAEKDVSMWEQLANAVAMQRWWADNQVSCTVKFDRQAEGADIASALELFEDQLKGISFLPHSHGYEQAPYEEIDPGYYDMLVRGIRPIDLSGVENEMQDKFCDGERCEVPRR